MRGWLSDKVITTNHRIAKMKIPVIGAMEIIEVKTYYNKEIVKNRSTV